ncbi:MAG: cytochrome b/b6 domain-containing protein [Cyanobacteria bacterium RI_101]|nr:cytochrome b/b6 domain-containing protein [Cyanobacteria bacterium RI_101]
MKPSQPYQPLLLRLLHGFTGLFLLAAMVTALWTYDTYDGRWGRLFLPVYREIEGIHGTFGLWTLLIFPGFVLYAFHRGRRRLLQPDSLGKLTQVGRPIWWYTLNRLTNTSALAALTFALFSGKMMDEDWLPDGNLTEGWYYAHLLSWALMAAALALHLLINAKVGGAPLLLSMLNFRFRAQDSPALWLAHCSQLWSERRRGTWKNPFQFSTALGALELGIFISLILAWVIPLIKDF